MRSVADLFLVNTRAENPLDAEVSNVDTTEEQNKSKVTDFVTQQSFVTFSASTIVFKALWK